ncbi:ATP-binding protein [Vallitalea maricola]
MKIGYLPVDQLGANLFFQLITKRYENNSTITYESTI